MPFNFPRPNFNNNNNSILFKGKGILPSVGVNLGPLGRLLSRNSQQGGIRKGHPGTGVYARASQGGSGITMPSEFLQKVADRLFSGGTDPSYIDAARWYYRNQLKNGRPREYPLGFTPPYAFRNTRDYTYGDLEDNKPEIARILRGVQPNIMDDFLSGASSFRSSEMMTILDLVNTLQYRKNILEKLDPRTRNFTFGLRDSVEHLQLNLENFQTTSDSDQELFTGVQFGQTQLVNFTKIKEDNEDPTILGFDIVIDDITSPLFNGTCEDFLEKFAEYSEEISSRKEILAEFITQFKRFFQTNSSRPEPTPKLKNYYITQLKGFEGFNHIRGKGSGGSSDTSSPSRFVNYPTDKITLLMNEDVELNFSYLSYLYNTLTWSRIEGKQPIPDNLLRFNVKIIISEIRNYNRVVSTMHLIQRTQDGVNQQTTQQKNNYNVISDLLSKREYNLYECRFYFPSHGWPDTSIDLGSSAGTKVVSPQTIEFDYKFVSSEFHKFEYNPQTNETESKKPIPELFNYTKYSDEQFNPKKLTNLDTNRAVISQGTDQGFTQSSFISLLDPVPEIFIKETIPYTRVPQGATSSLDALKRNAQNKSILRDLGKNILRGVAQAGANALNRALVKKFKNINKALDNLRNSNPLTSRMGPPRNIYRKENRLKNEVIGNIRSVLGPRNLRGAPGGGGETGIGPSTYRFSGSVPRINNPNNVYNFQGINSVSQQARNFLGPSFRNFFRNSN